MKSICPHKIKVWSLVEPVGKQHPPQFRSVLQSCAILGKVHVDHATTDGLVWS